MRARTRSWLLFAALLGAALSAFALRNLGRVPYDDAYFFKRFALHALGAGELAWNLDEGPVHGVTSQLWQLLAIPLTALAPDHFVLSGKLLALLASAVGACLLIRASGGEDGQGCALVAVSSPAWVYALLSGMETSLVLAWLTACALLALDERAAGKRWRVPIAVLVAYLARPDAAVLALAVLLAPLASPREQLIRAVLSAGALAVWLGVAKLYYGTALPLPFYAKTAGFSPYDAEFLAQCAESKRAHLALFAVAAVPLAGCALVRPDRHNAILLAGTAVFAGYHALLAVDVMGMHARFLLPALVPLALAGARGLASEGLGRRGLIALAATWLLACAALWHWPALGRAERIAPGLLAAHLFGCAALLAASVWPGLRTRVSWVVAGALLLACASVRPGDGLERLDDDAYLREHIARGTVFRGLPQLVACFGDGIHVYHSEAGVPGLLLARGKVTDLAGLLSREWLFRRTGFDGACRRERPAAIFLPHRNYRALNREIAASSCLRGYTRVVAESASPLYLRGDLAVRCPALRPAGE